MKMMFPGITVSEVWERITKPNIKPLTTINPLSILNADAKLPLSTTTIERFTCMI